jgi:hypothetical protein
MSLTMNMTKFLEDIPRPICGDKYDVLYYPHANRTAIPFFGDLETAEYVTVGVNPSSTELDKPFWRGNPDAAAKANYLNNYFKSGNEHTWFKGWERALAPLKLSFKANVAHLDLCTRGTKSVTAIQNDGNDELFLKMVEEEMSCFSRLFSEMFPRLKGVLLAGSVTGKFYLDEFLIDTLNTEFKFDPPRPFPRKQGRGRCEFYHISFQGKRIPIFFCTSSPSNKINPDLLEGRILDHLQRLRCLGF